MMINKQKIKKLAIIASASRTIPKDVEQYVLNHMGKQELKIFLKCYKTMLDKKRIYVTSADTISMEWMDKLKQIYDNKEIITTLDRTLGGGLRLIENDMVVDFTFKKYINDTIERLKN